VGRWRGWAASPGGPLARVGREPGWAAGAGGPLARVGRWRGWAWVTRTPEASTEGIPGTLGAVRVLVVEDERRLAAAVRRGLAAEGFAVDLAHNGEDGLHAAREGGYDAVVLDLMLPKISGYRVCQQLRAEENWVPILILSAKDGEYDQADGLDLGADDYLTKPFSYVVLAARLRALLRRGAIPRPAQLQAGDLTLDPATRRVRRGETDIELTAREFALLEYLMRRSGRVVAKTELLEHVWDSYDSLDLNVVEVYAGYLRRKIDAPFGRGALQTVRGAGYRLATDGG
jgi:DNA-binding response OmpR family regulator